MALTRKRLVLIRCAVALLLCCAASHACATVVWRVGSGSACEAHSIQQAVDLASRSASHDAQLIRLTPELNYVGQSVHIHNLDVTILGGLVACGSMFTGSAITVSGGNGPVFDISGTSHVVLSNLEIRNGHAATGGGINFVGNGTLSLDHTFIDANTASYGGGISAIASGGTIDIFLNTESVVMRNTASSSGGGIELEGQTYLYALAPNVLIGYNVANGGFGGGIDAYGQVTVTLGSSGYHGIPLIYSNSAAWGGGIALGGDGSAEHVGNLRLFTTNANAPVSVMDNSASVAGGGIYLKPQTDGPVPTARMCAQDFRINENVAPEGAALYLGWDTLLGFWEIGATAHMNYFDTCDEESLGAVHCAAGVACDEISGNVTADSHGNPTDGAIVLLGTSSLFEAKRTTMQFNVAGNMFKTIGDNDGGALVLQSCLTNSNQFAREMIYLQNDDNEVDIDQCTFAPDIINAAHVIRYDNSGGNILRLTNSIIDEPGTLTLSAPGGTQVFVENVLVDDGATLPGPPFVIVGEPTFVDPMHRDYHLQAISAGVDFATARSGDIDLDGNPRDVDLPARPNVFGPRDLGAYEVQH